VAAMDAVRKTLRTERLQQAFDRNPDVLLLHDLLAGA
jgi:hypothetical protein